MTARHSLASTAFDAIVLRIVYVPGHACVTTATQIGNPSAWISRKHVTEARASVRAFPTTAVFQNFFALTALDARDAKMVACIVGKRYLRQILREAHLGISN